METGEKGWFTNQQHHHLQFSSPTVPMQPSSEHDGVAGEEDPTSLGFGLVDVVWG